MGVVRSSDGSVVRSSGGSAVSVEKPKGFQGKPTSSAKLSQSAQIPANLPGAQAFVDNITSRLGLAGLSPGAQLPAAGNFTPSSGAQLDTRVKILCPTGSTIGRSVFESSILSPLRYTGENRFGVIFPFQPNISVIHSANYSMVQPAHTNYPYPAYENSMVQSIIIPGEFSASNLDEARYILAAIHFFRTATKMYYSNDANRGTPPPVLRLKGHGKYMFDDIPVVVTDFNYVLPDDVDYISVGTNDFSIGSPEQFLGSENTTMVPTSTVMNITVMPLYSRQQVSGEFSVKSFANGDLVSSGGKGGFI